MPESTTIDSAIAEVSEVIRTPLPLLSSEWADQHFYLSAESSGVEGKWKSYPYQIGILNWMGSVDIQIFTWRKAARTGYTKCLLADTGYSVTHKKQNVAIWQPTDSDAQDFVSDEINTMIRDVPVVGKALVGKPDVKSSNNTNQKKVFIGAVLDIKGGKSPRSFRRMTKDKVIYDELAGFDSDIGGEGSPTSLGDVRIQASPFGKSIRGSTPKERNTCLIEASLNEADKIFKRFVKCVHCGTFQPLEWSSMRWDDNDPSTTCYVCLNGCVLHYHSYSDMDKGGRWQSEDGTYYSDKHDLFFSPDGHYTDAPRHIGVILWGAYSYHMPWSDGVYDFLKARKAQKRGDVTPMKTWVNTYLGESWHEKGEQNDSDTLMARAEHTESLVIPTGGLLLTMGVDVQDDRLPYILVAWGRNEECWVIDYQEIEGNPDKKEVWDKLDEVVKRPYRYEGGGTINVVSAHIDSGHKQQDVYGFCRTRHPVCVPIKGSSQRNRPVLGQPRKQDVDYGGKKIPGGVELWPVGTDTAKGTIFSRLKSVTEPGENFIHFSNSLDEEFYKQLTAEKQVVRSVKGYPVIEWIKTRRRNEALDCFVYAYSAAIRTGMHRVDFDALETFVMGKREEARPVAKKKVSKKKRERW